MQLRTTQELATFAELVRQNGILAIDTEFLSGKTYYAKLCLVQLAAGGKAALVDPLELKDLSPLIDLMLDERVVKVMHAASQDMALLMRLCGRPPVPVFDTQLAATLAGYPSQIGYARLVADMTGVALEKSESFTDWSRRPLTPKQVEYALDDVLYLEPMYHKLLAKLQSSGRLGWLADDFRALSDPETYETPPERMFRSIKHASRLNGRQLAILREVAAWREREARRRNLPRQWVLKDEVLIELARRKPASVEALSEIRDVNVRSLGDRRSRAPSCPASSAGRCRRPIRRASSSSWAHWFASVPRSMASPFHCWPHRATSTCWRRARRRTIPSCRAGVGS